MKLGDKRMAVSGWEDKEARGDRKPDRVLRDSIQVAGGGPGWQVADPGSVPEPEDLNLIPDGRDLGPENGFPVTRHLKMYPQPIIRSPVSL